jgi:hypothetical protein
MNPFPALGWFAELAAGDHSINLFKDYLTP